MKKYWYFSLLLFAFVIAPSLAVAEKKKSDAWNFDLGLAHNPKGNPKEYRTGVDYEVTFRIKRVQLEIYPKQTKLAYAFVDNFFFVGSGYTYGDYNEYGSVPFFVGVKFSKFVYMQLKGGAIVNLGSLEHTVLEKSSTAQFTYTERTEPLNRVEPWGSISVGFEI